MRCERFDERTSQSSNRGDQLKSESWSRRTKSLVFQKPKREREKSAGLWSSFASTVNNDRVKKRQRFREYRVYSCCTNEKWTTWVSKITGFQHPLAGALRSISVGIALGDPENAKFMSTIFVAKYAPLRQGGKNEGMLMDLLYPLISNPFGSTGADRVSCDRSIHC